MRARSDVERRTFSAPSLKRSCPAQPKDRVEPNVLVARSAQAGRWTGHRTRLFHPIPTKEKAGL